MADEIFFTAGLIFIAAFVVVLVRGPSDLLDSEVSARDRKLNWCLLGALVCFVMALAVHHA